MLGVRKVDVTAVVILVSAAGLDWGKSETAGSMMGYAAVGGCGVASWATVARLVAECSLVREVGGGGNNSLIVARSMVGGEGGRGSGNGTDGVTV